jgi:hypothetical protein
MRIMIRFDRRTQLAFSLVALTSTTQGGGTDRRIFSRANM